MAVWLAFLNKLWVVPAHAQVWSSLFQKMNGSLSFTVFKNFHCLRGLSWVLTQTFLINYSSSFRISWNYLLKFLIIEPEAQKEPSDTVWFPFSMLHAPMWALSIQRFPNKWRKALRWELSWRDSLNLLVTIFYSISHLCVRGLGHPTGFNLMFKDIFTIYYHFHSYTGIFF